MDRKCLNCVWHDRCHEDEACESYEPLSLEEQEDAEVEAYNEDLRMRHEFYLEQVAEQDS